MSAENSIEYIEHQSCHNDEILEHIDDASQQEYVEKWAPKAQEELLIINQDEDSSPTSEVNIKLDERDDEHNNGEIITFEKQNCESVSHEVTLIDNVEDGEKDITIETELNDDYEVKDVTALINENSIEQSPSEVQEESFVVDEIKGENFEVVENLSEMEMNENMSEHEDKEEEVLSEEQRNKDEVLEKVEDLCEYLIEPESKEEYCVEAEIVEEAHLKDDLEKKSVGLLNENLEEPSPQECVDVAELMSSDSHNLQTNESAEVVDVPHKMAYSKLNGEKTLENQQPKDIKALSSSYNTEDTVNSDCEVCNKTVYPLEKISANNRNFHKQCFRCTKCRCALLAGNFSFNNDKPYCRPHYIELFKKRGRYDEIDDGETIALQTNINDILTDELPAPDITKNLLAKFRDLEAGAGTTASVSASNTDVTNELPAPNTTKNLMERFSALGKENNRDKNEQKRKPMIEIPRSEETDCSSGDCENQPISLSKDVVRANEPGQDEMPEHGITKNLVNRFRDLESTGVSSK